MHPPTIIASLALSLIALSSASPTPAPTAKPTKPSPLSSFYLKTCSNSTSKNNLYVAAYHTGAGQNDAVLVEKSGAIAGTLNDTSIIFYGLGAGVPWGLALVNEFYTRECRMLPLWCAIDMGGRSWRWKYVNRVVQGWNKPWSGLTGVWDPG